MTQRQTAIEWLIEEIHKNMSVWIPPHIQDQAKQMEADQSKADCDIARMQGWNKGYDEGHDEGFSKGYEEAMYDSINK